MAYVYLRRKKSPPAAAGASKATKKRAKRKPIYWMGYTDRNGDPKQESTGLTDEREAQAKADRKEREEMDIKDGIRPAESGRGVLFKTIAESYIETVLPSQKSSASTAGRIRNYLIPAFGDQLAAAILPADVQKFLNRARAPKTEDGEGGFGQSKSSAHKLRSHISSIYLHAMGEGLRMTDLESPVKESSAIKVPKKKPTPIPLAWIEPLLANVPRHYFALFVVALFTGLRKGELSALLVGDVDFERGMLHCGRSHEEDSTKGNKDRSVPINERLIPLLTNHVSGKAPSDPLFTSPDLGIKGKDGKLIPERALKPWAKPERIMRTALKKAGIVFGFEATCRKGRSKGTEWGCGYTAPRATANHGEKCPNCRRTLWIEPIPVKHSFKDLRSTFGTWLAKTANNVRAATILLGHSSVGVTEDSYALLMAEELRPEVNKLPFDFVERPLPLAASQGKTPSSPVAQGPYKSLTPEESGTAIVDGSSGFSSASSVSYVMRPEGFEPSAFGFEVQSKPSERGKTRVARGSIGRHGKEKTGGYASGLEQPVAPGSTRRRPAPDTLLTPLGPLTVLHGGGTRLLSPQHAADLLQVSRDSIYEAIKRGDFPAVRFGSAVIRIRASDLEAFLVRCATPTPKGTP